MKVREKIKSRNIVIIDVNLNIVGYINRYGSVRYSGTIGALTIIKASVLGILSIWQFRIAAIPGGCNPPALTGFRWFESNSCHKNLG